MAASIAPLLLACVVALVRASIAGEGKRRKRQIQDWKVQDVYKWALTQNISAANKLHDELVDGEMLILLHKEEIEEYLHLKPSVAQEIHDAIGRLIGLVDLTDEFKGKSDKKIPDGKCLIRCCCIDDNSVPGNRNRCTIVRRRSTWREWSPVGGGCGDEGPGWHSFRKFKQKKCEVPAELAPESRTCYGRQREGFSASSAVLLVVSAIGVLMRMAWFFWRVPLEKRPHVPEKRLLNCILRNVETLSPRLAQLVEQSFSFTESYITRFGDFLIGQIRSLQRKPSEGKSEDLKMPSKDEHDHLKKHSESRFEEDTSEDVTTPSEGDSACLGTWG
jgi:hypothetical protein